MPWKNSPDLLGLVGALIISIIAGFISISRRILNGYPATWLWAISEALTSLLCGYLMFLSYPYLMGSLPEWATWPLAVSFAAYSGGRVFQETEKWLLKRYQLLSALQKNNDDFMS